MTPQERRAVAAHALYLLALLGAFYALLVFVTALASWSQP